MRMLRILAVGYIAMGVTQIPLRRDAGRGDTMTPHVDLHYHHGHYPGAHRLWAGVPHPARGAAPWGSGTPDPLFVSILISWVMGAVITSTPSRMAAAGRKSPLCPPSRKRAAQKRGASGKWGKIREPRGSLWRKAPGARSRPCACPKILMAAPLLAGVVGGGIGGSWCAKRAAAGRWASSGARRSLWGRCTPGCPSWQLS